MFTRGYMSFCGNQGWKHRTVINFGWQKKCCNTLPSVPLILLWDRAMILVEPRKSETAHHSNPTFICSKLCNALYVSLSLSLSAHIYIVYIYDHLKLHPSIHQEVCENFLHSFY